MYVKIWTPGFMTDIRVDSDYDNHDIAALKNIVTVGQQCDGDDGDDNED